MLGRPKSNAKVVKIQKSNQGSKLTVDFRIAASEKARFCLFAYLLNDLLCVYVWCMHV